MAAPGLHIPPCQDGCFQRPLVSVPGLSWRTEVRLRKTSALVWLKKTGRFLPGGPDEEEPGSLVCTQPLSTPSTVNTQPSTDTHNQGPAGKSLFLDPFLDGHKPET